MNGRSAAPGRPPHRPFVVAHRSGNSLIALQAAEALGVEAIEADAHLYRRRIEIRHLKTLGPVPILWDRWSLASPFAPRLVAGELLAAVGPQTELVLDLKGRDRRLSAALLEALAARLAAGGRTTICARHWPLLDPFRGVDGLRRVYSVGSARGLRRLRRHLEGNHAEAVTIHERLLDSATVQELRELADTVMSWPINTLDRAEELVRWGVDGLITDRPALVQPAHWRNP